MATPKRISSAAILAELDDRDSRNLASFGVTVTLDDGDSAWNPASTSSLIYGPCKVLYVRHPDGGITATETETPAAPKRRTR